MVFHKSRPFASSEAEAGSAPAAVETLESQRSDLTGQLKEVCFVFFPQYRGGWSRALGSRVAF